MIKYIEFNTSDPDVEVNTYHPGILEKTAEMSSELVDFLKSIEATPGKYFLHINALGAGEYFSSNRNGDYFPEIALIEYHKTFETNANLYRHHKNKPHLGHKKYGKVLFSHYNKNMHRVELVIEFDTITAPDLKDRIDAGENLAFSMGARVKYDECSICGNKAKNLGEYCEHLKYQMNRVLPDGRKVYAINRHPKFFDISFVTIPADKTAYMFSKVAEYADEDEVIEKLIKESEKIKKAEITKNIPGGELLEYGKDPNELIYKSQPNMPNELINEMSSFPINKILSTLLSLRIMPKRRDFQSILLNSSGQSDVAKQLLDKNIIFRVPPVREIPDKYNNMEGIYPENSCEDVFNIIKKHESYVSRAPLTKPVIVLRIMEKVADAQEGSKMEQEGLLPGENIEAKIKLNGIKNPVIPMSAMGGLYYGYSKLYNTLNDTKGLQALLLNKPWLLPVLIGAGSLGSVGVQSLFNKTASPKDPGFLLSSLISVPITYLYSGVQEGKVRRGEPISAYGNLVRKHPFLMSLVHGYGGNKAVGLMKKASIGNRVSEAFLELPENKFNEIYEYLIEKT